MRKFLLSLAALAVATPVAVTFTPDGAEAQTYRGRSYYWDCKKRGGTTGALVGGAGGAVLGSAIGGTGATIAGAALGALGGREIERSNKKRNCIKRYYRRR